MSERNPSRGVINFGMAMALFGVLALLSIVVLKGTALFFALLIIGALAVKSYVHHIRSRMEDSTE